MSALRATTFISLEDYLAIDRDLPDRHEFRNGERFYREGTQPKHNTICLNLGSELRVQLRGGLCRAFPSDQRVKVNAGNPYLYPDLSMACEPRLIDRLDGELKLDDPAVAVSMAEIYLDTGLVP